MTIFGSDVGSHVSNNVDSNSNFVHNWATKTPPRLFVFSYITAMWVRNLFLWARVLMPSFNQLFLSFCSYSPLVNLLSISDFVFTSHWHLINFLLTSYSPFIHLLLTSCSPLMHVLFTSCWHLIHRVLTSYWPLIHLLANRAFIAYWRL